MTEDRELLELAAKAAGIEIYFDEDGGSYRVKASGNRNYWNPLLFDGDALRLAVKLRLIIDPVVETLDGTDPCAAVWCRPKRKYIIEPFNDDADAATRRAIVRAAAEIGRSME